MFFLSIFLFYGIVQLAWIWFDPNNFMQMRYFYLCIFDCRNMALPKWSIEEERKARRMFRLPLEVQLSLDEMHIVTRYPTELNKGYLKKFLRILQYKWERRASWWSPIWKLDMKTMGWMSLIKTSAVNMAQAYWLLPWSLESLEKSEFSLKKS